MLEVTVEYFALFRECAGKTSEPWACASAQAADLFEALRGRYRFPLDKNKVLLAVNDEFASWENPLRPGDRVAFLPPVSGG